MLSKLVFGSIKEIFAREIQFGSDFRLSGIFIKYVHSNTNFGHIINFNFIFLVELTSKTKLWNAMDGLQICLKWPRNGARLVKLL